MTSLSVELEACPGIRIFRVGSGANSHRTVTFQTIPASNLMNEDLNQKIIHSKFSKFDEVFSKLELY